MSLSAELASVAAAAAAFAAEGEQVSGVLAADTVAGERLYLCAFEGAASAAARGAGFGTGDGRRGWLVLDARGGAVRGRALVREAVSVAALCELAEETAGGGDLAQLRERLLALRLTEAPAGIEDAEAAALALEHAVAAPPRVASAAYLDRLGDAARRLERALGETGHSPFGAAMQVAAGSVDELVADVEAGYKVELR